MNSPSLSDLIQSRKILVTCGTGGVGKTTVSAALGILAARMGRKALVITIDPAKRLKTSLGMDALGAIPHDLTPSLRAVVEEPIAGEIHALMPDSRQTFERFFRSLTDQQQVIDRVLRNPMLTSFADEYSGANEYLALEELDHYAGNARYDLLILDTPPSRNTVSFLQAPRLLARLFEERLVRWLVLPTQSVLAFGMKKAFSVLESLTGKGFIGLLVDFGQAMVEVQDGFLKKLRTIHRRLQSTDTGFLLIASPTPESAPDLGRFLDEVRQQGFHFEGLILNRSLSHLRDDPQLQSPGLKVLRGLRDREKETFRLLEGSTSDRVTVHLPELVRDVHSLRDLFEISELMRDPRHTVARAPQESQP